MAQYLGQYVNSQRGRSPLREIECRQLVAAGETGLKILKFSGPAKATELLVAKNKISSKGIIPKYMPASQNR